MNTVGRGEASFLISQGLGLPESTVSRILKEYTRYIKDKVSQGQSVGILRIAYLVVPDYDGLIDTLSYVCTELGNLLNIPSEMVKGVLFYYENCIIRDLKKAYRYNLYGLLSLNMIEDGEGNINVRAKRSAVLTGYRLSVRRSFTRKVNRLKDDGKDS